MRFRWILIACSLLASVPDSVLGQPAKARPAKTQDVTTYDGEPSAVWLARLKDPDDTVRLRAAYALGQITPPAPQTVPALIKAVDDRAQEVRWYSADSLGRLGPAAKSGVAVLLAGVKDPANDKPFALSATQALGRIGPAADDAVPWLLESLRGDYPPLRVAAALALWRIKKQPEALTTLTESLADPSGEVSYLASLALLEIGPEARPTASALVKALGHESADARRAAARVIAGLGPEMIAVLCQELAGGALQSEPQPQLEFGVIALSYLIDDARTKAIYNPRVTEAEFSAAERNCVETALPTLVKLFDDPHDGVRKEASRAVAKIGLPAVPALLAALSDQNERTQVSAAEALTRLEDELPGGRFSPPLSAVQRRLVGPLVAALKRPSPVVRSLTLRLFAELTWGPEAQEAAPLLRDALKSEDALIRRHAAKALKQVNQAASLNNQPRSATDPR